VLARLSLVVAMALSSGARAHDQRTFDQLVVLGDSLSDMGNAGRFSNGPVWVEQLAESLELPLSASERGGQNFAVGGARIEAGPQSLRAQVNKFLKLPRPSGRTLYIVWGGANDIFAAIGQPDAPSELDAAAAALNEVLADLMAHGGTDLLVPNIPDVGITPEVRAQGSEAVNETRRLTAHFNRAVERRLTDLASSWRGIRLYRLDVAAMAERARRDPASFGFTDISTPCRGSARCAEYVFWDDIHPTTTAHARLAEAALGALSVQQ
jgi:phospholipase/lecithinase/hemolysin